MGAGKIKRLLRDGVVGDRASACYPRVGRQSRAHHEVVTALPVSPA